jgi:hypothetical protein
MAVFCLDVFSRFKGKQGPMLRISAKDHMTTTTSITSIRTAFGLVSLTQKMRTPAAAISGGKINLYVIDEVR